MARLMGGNIGIESPPGKGATFFVKLPLRRAAAEPPAAVPAAEEANVALPAALIVEDEHYNQIVLAGMVGKLGYQTECVGGSDKALAAAVRRAFDVVFLDIELPLVKGPEVARRLRALPGGSRPLLIGVSANDSREAADRCFAAGMDAFVTKPFSVATLQAAVAGARARRQAGDAAGGPDLDFAALELYAQNVPGGLAGAVTSYSRILREEIAALQQALEDRHSAEAVARAAHRVRSHATVVGAAGVVQAAARLEMAARAGHMADGAAHFSQIQRAAEEIGQLLSEKA